MMHAQTADYQLAARGAANATIEISFRGPRVGRTVPQTAPIFP